MEDDEFNSFYNEKIIAQPFQLIKGSDENKSPTNKEIKSLQIQNNYSNRMLTTITKTSRWRINWTTKRRKKGFNHI